jgi:hypothetical protein
MSTVTGCWSLPCPGALYRMSKDGLPRRFLDVVGFAIASWQAAQAFAGSITQPRFGLPDDDPVPRKMISDRRLPSSLGASNLSSLSPRARANSPSGANLRIHAPTADLIDLTTPTKKRIQPPAERGEDSGRSTESNSIALSSLHAIINQFVPSTACFNPCCWSVHSSADECWCLPKVQWCLCILGLGPLKTPLKLKTQNQRPTLRVTSLHARNADVRLVGHGTEC